MPAFLNFRGLGHTESLTDWRNSYFGKSTMEANTKKVTDLVAGDRVLMDDGQTRVVKAVGKGFVKYRDEATGKLKPSIMIDWKDGSFSQMPNDDIATLAPVIRRGTTA